MILKFMLLLIFNMLTVILINNTYSVIDNMNIYVKIHWYYISEHLFIFFFFGVHPLRMTTTSSSTLKHNMTQHEEEESMC